jgi:hypothetical protein
MVLVAWTTVFRDAALIFHDGVSAGPYATTGLAEAVVGSPYATMTFVEG